MTRIAFRRAQRYDTARRCEESGQVRCHCRCGGQFHGARRFDFRTNPFGLARLAPTDPHFVPAHRHPADVIASNRATYKELHERTRRT